MEVTVTARVSCSCQLTKMLEKLNYSFFYFSIKNVNLITGTAIYSKSNYYEFKNDFCIR